MALTTVGMLVACAALVLAFLVAVSSELLAAVTWLSSCIKPNILNKNQVEGTTQECAKKPLPTPAAEAEEAGCSLPEEGKQTHLGRTAQPTRVVIERIDNFILNYRTPEPSGVGDRQTFASGAR